MAIGELLLQAACREPTAGDYNAVPPYEAPGQELSLLRREFPEFSAIVRGKRVADFGCGTGHQALALVREEGCRVCGIDTNTASLARARRLAATVRAPDGALRFVERPSRGMQGGFDVVISQNSMEHFADPAGALGQMRDLLHEGGRILVTFGPPWLAPFGSHMQFFCRLPWVNVVFPERTVLSVRSHYRSDGARRYEEVESGLNRMTVSKFEHVVAQSALVIEFRRYTCVKRLNWLASVPGVREFMVNQVSCVLKRLEASRRAAS